jgi:hypothetical protein
VDTFKWLGYVHVNQHFLPSGLYIFLSTVVRLEFTNVSKVWHGFCSFVCYFLFFCLLLFVLLFVTFCSFVCYFLFFCLLLFVLLFVTFCSVFVFCFLFWFFFFSFCFVFLFDIGGLINHHCSISFW